MTRTVKRPGAALAVLAGLALTLTACSGPSDAIISGTSGDGADDDDTGASQEVGEEGADEVDAVVYEFEQAKVTTQEQEPVVAVDQPIIVRLSDELKAAVPADKSVVIDQYTLTVKAFPTTGKCRLDIDIEYTNDSAADAYFGEAASDDSQMRYKLMSLLNFGESITYVDTVPTDDELGSDGPFWFTNDHAHGVYVDDCVDETMTNRMLVFPYEDGGTFAAVDVTARSNSQMSDNDETATVINQGGAVADVSVTGHWQTPADD